MPENRIDGQKPLWLLIEKEIQSCQTADLADDRRLDTAKKIAATLDQTGYNVSGSAGNWRQLNSAMVASSSVGKPFLNDCDQALAALTLDGIEDTNATAWGIITDLATDWPFIMEPDNRSDVKDMVGDRRIELVIEHARELGGEQGIRFLIAESFAPARIVKILGISEDEYKAVQAP